MDYITKRRRHQRVNLEHMNVRASTILTSECKILDMGIRGVRLATTQPLNIDDNYSIKFNVGGRRIINKGTVRWARLVGNQKGSDQESVPIYMTGLEFKSVLTDKGQELFHVLGECSGRDERRYSGKRFQITTSRKTVLNVFREYPLKQISSGGMLVETDQELPPDKRLLWAFHSPGDGNIIRCQGRVASCRETFMNNRKRYNIGIEFVEVQKEDRRRLTRFVMKAMVDELKTSLLN
jgi:hypothetical protein